MILGGTLMDKIAYFKLQAKNLFRDFKTQTFDEEGLTRYSPRFLKILMIFFCPMMLMKKTLN